MSSNFTYLKPKTDFFLNKTDHDVYVMWFNSYTFDNDVLCYEELVNRNATKELSIISNSMWYKRKYYLKNWSP